MVGPFVGWLPMPHRQRWLAEDFAVWSNCGLEEFCFVCRAISNSLILVSRGPAQVNDYVFDVFQF
jgi:hypothetical protein